MTFYSDVDDTIMQNALISSKLEHFLTNINKDKYNFIPCSGRPTDSLNKIFKKFNIQYVIGFNGGEIFDLYTNKVIFSSKINIKTVNEVTKYLESKNIDYILYDNDTLYTNNLTNEYAQLESELTFLQLKKKTINIETIKILGLNDPKYIDENISKLKEEFPTLEFVKSKPFFIEITNKQINKGNAICKLNDILGIDHDETYVFGDSDNDISMFNLKFVKKIAVKNANKNIINRADKICNSCTDDGVVTYIEELIKL